MTWNFFYLNMYGKKYIEKAKNTLQGVPKKEFVFQNVQILVDKNFLKVTILSSGKVENVCKFICTIMPTKMSGRQRIPYRVFKKKNFSQILLIFVR